MKKFACALVAASAVAQSFIDYTIKFDNDNVTKQLTTKEWSRSEVDGETLKISGNNSLFMRSAESLDDRSVFKPAIRGGSFEYDVNVSGQDSGCVAGVYLVNTDDGNCGEIDQFGTPQCKSIDVMQANLYGFETKAHPCTNGTCDAVSECIAGMQQQGVEKYGSDAYGPNGSLIDTNADFHVMNEFVSTTNYQTFWKLRTTLTQGGNKIILENDCRDYMGALSTTIEGQMGIVFSSWDNTDSQEKFELNQGQSAASTCENASSVIRNFSVKQYGSTESMPDDGSDAQDGFLKFSVDVDGSEIIKYLTNKEWSEAYTSDDRKEIQMRGNNSLFLRESEDEDLRSSSLFKPLIRGGSISYTVDLSTQNSGCVAGVYLLAPDNDQCSEVNQRGGSSPQCRTIDAMQANLFGFETKAHPCTNGTCDAISQCIIGMQNEGIEKYGADAYGPGGTIIDTSIAFKVFNEFVSDKSYMNFWKLRTTLSQGSDEIIMEADCRDYLSALNGPIEGGMGFIFANWDNTNGAEDFELDYGQKPDSSCDDSWAFIKDFSVKQWGSTEDMPEPSPEPEPEPSPEPAQFLPVETYSDMEGGDFITYVKGLDGQCLETEGSGMKMGENNRSWIHAFATTESDSAAYKHYYLGGTLEYEVDLSQVECACASGVYLVDSSTEGCSWDAKEGSISPQCSRVEVMEANKLGFTAASYPCEFGVCSNRSKTEQITDDSQFGPGSDYTIDSTQPFKVTTKFFAPLKDDPLDNGNTFGDLVKIETCLQQGESMVTLIQDDEDYLYALSEKLSSDMAIVVSNFDAGMTNDMNRGQCTSACGEYKSKLYNIKFTSMDSIYEEEPVDEMVIGELAQSLEQCEDPFCSACHVAWWSGDETNRFHTCTDYTRYRYTNQCSSWQSKALCGADDKCFKSYPHDDPKKWKSDDYGCRPLPSRLEEGDYQYARRNCRSTKGLCADNCEFATCHMSWPIGDTDRWRSADAMCRCKEED